MLTMTAIELRAAIAALGLSQKDFSEVFRIPQRTLSRYLAGDPIPDTTAMLVRMLVARRNWRDMLNIGYGGGMP